MDDENKNIVEDEDGDEGEDVEEGEPKPEAAE